jgi:hypothetical protein
VSAPRTAGLKAERRDADLIPMTRDGAGAAVTAGAKRSGAGSGTGAQTSWTMIAFGVLTTVFVVAKLEGYIVNPTLELAAAALIAVSGILALVDRRARQR